MLDHIELPAPFLLETCHLKTAFASSVLGEYVRIQPDENLERSPRPIDEGRHDFSHDAFTPEVLTQPRMVESVSYLMSDSDKSQHSTYQYPNSAVRA